ncbi:MAG TPA: M56 family metallopeptidase [Bryobacteraceae bacterium]|nr:M56 family metallopeptidase [Bryobacteraceae bacterium]
MTSLLLQNLAFYSLQIAVIAAAGALAMRLLQIRIPSVRLVCWQLLIGACLALPAVQPWLSAKANSNIRISMGPPIIGGAYESSRGLTISAFAIILCVMAGGAVIRLGILALGLWRLRRYRLHSTFAPGAFEQLQRRMSVFADVQVSTEVAGPVTFGFLRPVILLPQTCLTDESVACHELVHIRRRDWIFTVIEECILSIFWFHPAMWWMVSEIQLAREEAVDREVVALLNSRDQYLESLLAQASSRAGFDLAPASPFLRKRHLQKRVAALLKEISMSKFRLTSSLAAFAAVLTLTAWLGVRSFPLQAAPQESDSSNIMVHAGSLQFLHLDRANYPKEARAKRIEGTVVLEISLSDTGTVTDARVLSGPEELRRGALAWALEWHFAHDTQLPPKAQVSVDYKLPVAEPAPGTLLAPADELARLDSLMLFVSPALKQKLDSRITLHAGDRITQSSLNELVGTLSEVDEHLRASLFPDKDKNGSSIKIWLDNGNEAPKRIRVGGNVQATNIIQKVQPVYPAEAKAQHIQGQVKFTVIIGKDGTVQNITLVSGDPMLAAAAKEAVQKWVYKPTLLNGDPVEVVTTIDVNFTLAQ